MHASWTRIFMFFRSQIKKKYRSDKLESLFDALYCIRIVLWISFLADVFDLAIIFKSLVQGSTIKSHKWKRTTPKGVADSYSCEIYWRIFFFYKAYMSYTNTYIKTLWHECHIKPTHKKILILNTWFTSQGHLNYTL